MFLAGSQNDLPGVGTEPALGIPFQVNHKDGFFLGLSPTHSLLSTSKLRICLVWRERENLWALCLFAGSVNAGLSLRGTTFEAGAKKHLEKSHQFWVILFGRTPKLACRTAGLIQVPTFKYRGNSF